MLAGTPPSAEPQAEPGAQQELDTTRLKSSYLNSGAGWPDPFTLG